jgi:hypothetical protein
MINFFLILFGNNSQISDDLMSVLGENIIKMVENDTVILITLKSEDSIENIKEMVNMVGVPFILIGKNQFKDIALQIDDDVKKYLFDSKSKKVTKKNDENVVLDLNTILDKIGNNGINSLKKEEKDFLKSFN